MANFVDSSFEGQTIVLDGNDYLRCRFLRCRIIVTRGNFSVRECTFDTCNFEFSGVAKRRILERSCSPCEISDQLLQGTSYSGAPFTF